MPLRKSSAAGRFYPADEASCIDLIMYCLQKASGVKKDYEASGALVPHAGWVFSGHLATKALLSIPQDSAPDTFVIFGAVHYPGVERISIFPSGLWETPVGNVEVDAEAASAIAAEPKSMAVLSMRAHEKEHSIDVLVPLISYLFPQAKILPVAFPPIDFSAEAGKIFARILNGMRRKCFFIASSDLTHYGISYGMTNHGIGPDAEKWVMKVNDKMLLDKILCMDDSGLIDIVEENYCACGPGAIAGAIGACRECGAKRGIILEHTNSSVTSGDKWGSHSFVSYASALFTASVPKNTFF